MEKTSSNLQEKTPTTRRVGGWEIRQWQMATRKVSNVMGHVTYIPRILAPRLPDVCEKTFSTSFVPQPAENNTYKIISYQHDSTLCNVSRENWIWSYIHHLKWTFKVSLKHNARIKHPYKIWYQLFENAWEFTSNRTVGSLRS